MLCGVRTWRAKGRRDTSTRPSAPTGSGADAPTAPTAPTADAAGSSNPLAFAGSSVQRRKLNLKAFFESGSSYSSFKS